MTIPVAACAPMGVDSGVFEESYPYDIFPAGGVRRVVRED